MGFVEDGTEVGVIAKAKRWRVFTRMTRQGS